MARMNRDRHVWGETNPIQCLAANDQMVMTGDICYMTGTTSSLYPLSYVWGDNIGNHVPFIGVAMQYSIDQDPLEVRVATSGVFEFDTSDTFIVGEGIYQLINPQTVYGTGNRTTTSGIIGRAWKRYASTTTKVLVKIDNTGLFPHAST